MSSKTVLSSIIPAVVNQKGNTLYNLFAMKVAFSSLYFVFSVFFVFLLIFYLFYRLQFSHGVQNGLQLFKQFFVNFPRIFRNSDFTKNPITLHLRSLNIMPYNVNVSNKMQKYILTKKFQLMLKILCVGLQTQNFEFLFWQFFFLNFELLNIRHV